MAWLAKLLARIGICGLALLLSALNTHARAQVFPVCSWPFESDGHGITNVATPDTHATYWVMPFDTTTWKSMVIRGEYAQARFFNFDSYTETGAIVASVVDSSITPDPGSSNPFATPNPSGARNYAVTVGASGPSNLLKVGSTRLAFIVYRVYLPNEGLDRTGGVGLPAVSLVASNGTERALLPCPFADAETSLGNLIIALSVNGFTEGASFLQSILTAVNQRPIGTASCNPAQPGPAAVSFAPATLGANFFANPQTTYLETDALCFQQGKVIVVRGKGQVFPNTYLGGSVFQPAFDGQIQVRYWSMCNNDRVIPYPVIACQADYQTALGSDQFYTYVMSSDPALPSWLPAGVTWLPWGPTNIPKNLIFRNINETASGVPADYVPKGAFCDQTVFAQQGWQACFAAAGIH